MTIASHFPLLALILIIFAVLPTVACITPPIMMDGKYATFQWTMSSSILDLYANSRMPSAHFMNKID